MFSGAYFFFSLFMAITLAYSANAQNLKNKEILPGSYLKNAQLSEFTTDGCSLFPDGTDENKTLWQECCVQHDVKYWLGGTKNERQQADAELAKCVSEKHSPLLGAIMYLGVRVGGTSYATTTYRWGYGWNYIRGYDPLSKIEIQMSQQLYGEGLKDLVSNIKNNKVMVKEVTETADYKFKDNLDYNYCEEKILKYLSEKMTLPATIEKVRIIQDSYNYVYRVKLSTCDRSLEFFFDNTTNDYTCEYPQEISNNLVRVYKSKSCEI